jgi:hypothetical protein
MTHKVANPGQCPYNTKETKFGNCSQLPPDRAAQVNAETAVLEAAARRLVGPCAMGLQACGRFTVGRMDVRLMAPCRGGEGPVGRPDLPHGLTCAPASPRL